MRTVPALIVITSLVFATTRFSRGQASLPFLLISPSTEANGMGEALVANHTDDPLALMANPAHLGMLSQSRMFSFGYNYARWLPQFQQSDLYLSTFAIDGGLSLDMLTETTLPLSVGFAYSRVFLNLGRFYRTDASGQVIGTYDASESSDQFSLAVGFDYWIKASIGMTYKHVVSRLVFVGTDDNAYDGKANLVDYGFLIDVPVIRIISRITDTPIQRRSGLLPFFDWSVGISRSNLGQESLVYYDPTQADPLPRFARAGMSVDLGLEVCRNHAVWKPVSFQWAIEASDLLVAGPNREYQSGLGDIRFFDEVILGKTNRETEKRKGWELGFFELILIRGGRFEEDPNRGNRRFTTSGFGIRLGGLRKTLRGLDVAIPDAGVVGFILNHLEIGYDHSELTTDAPRAPLSGTKFDAVSISVSR